MQQATVTGRALEGLQYRCGLQGIDVVALGRRHGLADTLWDDLGCEVPLRSFAGLMDALASASDDPAALWRLGRAFDVRRLGAIGRALLLERTLGDALARFRDHLCLLQDDAEMSLEVDGDVTVLRYRILDPTIEPRRADAEFTLGVLQHIVDRFVGGSGCPTRLVFERGSGEVGALAAVIGVPCAGGADSNELRLPTRLLGSAAPRAADAVPEEERARLRAELERRRRQRLRAMPYARRVRCALLRRLGSGASFGQAEVAAELHVTRRTLRRRLAEEGSGYLELLRECRLDLARRELAHGELGCAEIALRAGYSDQSAFTRSFTRACGQTPGRFRRLARSAGALRS